MKGNEAKRLRILAVGDESEKTIVWRQVFEEPKDRRKSDYIFELAVSFSGNQAIETVKKALRDDDPFAVVMIDAVLSANSEGVWTGGQIRKIDPDVNFILLTDTLDVDLADIIARISLESKVLYLNKPFHRKELKQFVTAAGAMWLTEKELQKANLELHELNSQLLETNDALSVLARNLDGNRRESEKRITQRTRTLIIPVIEKLQRERNLEKYSVELDLLMSYIEDLTADLASDLKIASVLSTTELRIASMIKNGMSSEEIAQYQHISIYTVKTHRKNIRKKLKLQNTGMSLRVHLESERFKFKK
jgi:DNA-binding CsgD family transcriptional regulator/CheY-like chemotaxis protein